MKLTHIPRLALLGCAAALSARTDRHTDDAGSTPHANKAASATTISAGHSPHAGGALNIGAQGGVQTSAKKFGTTLDGEGSALGTFNAAALATDGSTASGTRLLQ